MAAMRNTDEMCGSGGMHGPGRGRRWLWFAALWAASVAVTAIAAYGLRALLEL